MLKKLKNAYYNGWRGGMSDPVLYAVNGLKYVVQPQCPYQRPHQVALRWIWSAGKHNGQIRRLSAVKQARHG